MNPKEIIERCNDMIKRLAHEAYGKQNSEAIKDINTLDEDGDNFVRKDYTKVGLVEYKYEVKKPGVTARISLSQLLVSFGLHVLYFTLLMTHILKQICSLSLCSQLQCSFREKGMSKGIRRLGQCLQFRPGLTQR